MANPGPQLVVINDDPVQLHLLTRLLEGAGYDTLGHVDSSEALARLAKGPRVDLFVVDLHMPGIDGWKVCRLLRSPELRAYNETPILVVSATFTGADVEAITADIGADGFLPMPLSRDDLLNHVRDLLDGVRPRIRSRALVVEDDDRTAEHLVRTFDQNGYDVVRVASLAEAKRSWIDMAPDVVLLDYHLPDGAGTDLIEELHSESDATVVLVTTGDTDPDLPVEMLQLGADGYVRKPFDPELLVELAGKARRARSLLRVEALLELRTTELRGSEARYRSLFEAIPDVVLTIDGSDRVIAANGEAVRALGHSIEDVEGRPLAELLADDAREPTLRELARVRMGGAAPFETRLVGVGGRDLPVEVTAAAPEPLDSGSLVLVARDITERRRAEDERRRLDEQVQHTQRLESLGVLAGGIAHDFNNLLVGVMGNASLALLDIEEGSSVHECVTQIETAARRAAELTRQILTFAGKGESAMSPQDLSNVVSEMGQLLAPAVSKKAQLSYRLGRNLPVVEADASQLRQVVMNLIMNASDALDGATGRIDVETGVHELQAAEARLYMLGDTASPGTYVSVAVTDDGCGMDEETKRQIFDPFFTTKFAGRGLGLAATLGIIRAHGGLISVESTPGQGTRIRVLLPALDSMAPTKHDTHLHRSDLSRGSGSVLVVDDEAAVRTLATNALRRAGYQVIGAEDGPRALNLLERHPQIDVVILDLTMPGMDGLEVLEAIRRINPELPVLLSSGYPAESLKAGTLEEGVTEFLRKPYSPVGLMARVSDLLGPDEEPEIGVPASGAGSRAKVSGGSR